MPYSDFRILTTIGEKGQIAPLLTIACALASARDGAVTVLCVTPDGQRPDWLVVPDKQQEVTIRTVVRAGRNAGKVILEATHSLRPDLLLVGWSGSPGQRSYLLGSTLDPIIRYAPCDVAVVRLDDLGSTRRALVPMSSGPNAPLALELALQLARDGQVTALNVARESLGPTAEAAGYAQLNNVLEPWHGDERVSAKVVCAPSIIQGILDEAAAGYDLLLIGASNESYIDRKLFGNVPQTIASEAPIPTVVVRHRVSALRLFIRQAVLRLSGLQGNLTVAQQVETYREIRRGARARSEFFVLISLASAIAALGLLLNSPAVIIGAMVIAPLMSAILGISLGIVQGDARLLWGATFTTVRGAGLAILVGAVISALVPGKELTAEILGRTQPTLLDLGVALFSGIVGAYAQCRRDVLNALSGVAIAVALVPPLATAGIGITMSNWPVATGALLLFLTNLIAIVATGSAVLLFFGFRPDPGRRFRVFGRSMIGATALLVTVVIALTLLTANSIRSSAFQRQVQSALQQELEAMPGVALESWALEEPVGTTLHLMVRVRAAQEISRQDAEVLQRGLAERLQRPVAMILSVLPSTQLDTFVPSPSS